MGVEELKPRERLFAAMTGFQSDGDNEAGRKMCRADVEYATT